MSDPGQPPEGGWPSLRPDADDGPSTGAPNPWDPPVAPDGSPATAPPPPPPQAPPPGSIPPAYIPSAGGAPSGAASERRIKPASVTGRRPPSIAIIGGLGLLGLLITIAIMAILSNRVLSGTTDAGDVLNGTVPPELTTATSAPPDPGAPTTSAATGPKGLTDAATAAACQVDHDTLDTAIQAYELMTGAPPTDQDALVAAGVLAEPVAGFTVTLGISGVEITGVGDCEGT